MWLSWYCCDQGLNSTFFKMNNLVVLRISGLKSDNGCVDKLMMRNLKVLEISDSRMTITPDVSYCVKLDLITFRSCHNLQAIHDSICKLENLTSLNISKCSSMRSLPEQLGCARALRELIVKFTAVEEIPDSIGRLESLSILVLKSNKMRKLPSSIWYLKSLKELDASHCPLEGRIPEEIGRLSALVNLNLEYSELCQLPTTISQLSSLKSLNLDGCHRLQELPELPTSLTKLTFVSRSLQVVRNLSVLSNLTELILCNDCVSRKYHRVAHCMRSQSKPLKPSWLGKMNKLKSLHLCLWGITHVISTKLGSLSRLEELHLSCPDMASISQLPSSLFKLRLLDSRTAIPWGYYSNLRLLTMLDLINSTLMDIQLDGLDSLLSLKTLNIVYCKKLKRLSNLGCLKRLTSLSLENCPRLVEVPGLEELVPLEILNIRSCTSIPSIPDLLNLRRLRRVLNA